MTDIHSERILILDFGSQYTQLIARRVREAGVYSEIHSYEIDDQKIKDFKPSAIILSGGPESVTSLNGFRAPKLVFDIDEPVLGICYGMQTMAEQLGGKVANSNLIEFGYAQIRARGHSDLLKDIQDETNSEGHGLLNVWMSHAEQVESLPEGFKSIASTDNTSIAAMADETRKFYGLQFHPEVTHTTQGFKILERFIHQIAGCQSLWTTEKIIERSIAQVKKQVGNDRVLLALSGGVDSSVVAALLHKAIGKQLTCVFVDNGLLRLNEADQVMETFAKHMGIHVIRVDAEARFLKALKGISDPEKKRKVIGVEFIKVFEEQAKSLEGINWLAQGTIYPDVIESAGAETGKAHVIKSHHNVGGLPKKMKLKLVEPLRLLFKDEVRKLGLELKLSKEIVLRHPFPGPGLAIRMPGEITQQKIKILKDADDIFIKALRDYDLYNKIWQAYAALLPVKTVGVMGDNRTYEYMCLLRAITSEDGMTADTFNFNKDFIQFVSNKIINNIKGINRVVYDITSKPPSTIELE